MNTESKIPVTGLYADEAPSGYVEPPTSTQFHAGVEPEMTLPAAWWNYFVNLFTSTNIKAKEDITAILAELNNALTGGGVTPDPEAANQLLTLLQKGHGSTVNADTVDGSHYNATDILTKLKTVDGSGSGLDADLLDGAQRSVFMERKNQYISDFNAISSSMVGNGETITFMSSFSPANRPSSSSNYYTGFISNQSADGKYLTVLAFGSIASDNFWFRRLTAGVWGPWVKIWNSGNMGLPFGSGGASGLSTLVCTVKYVADANNIDGNGIIFSTNGSPTNFPTVNYYAGIQFYIAQNPEYKIQIIHGNSHGAAYIRYSHAGSWGTWHKLWNSGNDGPGSGLAADTAATAATADYATNAYGATNATNATNSYGTSRPSAGADQHGRFYYLTDTNSLWYCARWGLSSYKWVKIST